jgi:ribonuclease VapC
VIVDSSALVALVLAEPGWEDVARKLERARMAGIGAPTLLETNIVLSHTLRSDARARIARLLQEAGITVLPFGEANWRAAADAWWRFGKGRHRAALNYGDCLSHATASLAAQPLLFVGDDFAHTDLKRRRSPVSQQTGLPSTLRPQALHAPTARGDRLADPAATWLGWTPAPKRARCSAG